MRSIRHPRRSLRPISTTLLVASLAANATADFDYPDFASTAGLTLVGAAAQNGTALRLVPAPPPVRRPRRAPLRVPTASTGRRRAARSSRRATCPTPWSATSSGTGSAPRSVVCRLKTSQEFVECMQHLLGKSLTDLVLKFAAIFKQGGQPLRAWQAEEPLLPKQQPHRR